MRATDRAVDPGEQLHTSSANALAASFVSQKDHRLWFRTAAGWTSRQRTKEERAYIDTVVAELAAGGAA